MLLAALPGLAPAFLIVLLLACVLVPLPTQVVDLLLSISLSGAVLLLVASIGIKRTTEFLAFPSLLLLVTLYRLALNVSTTRLILSDQDAGRVIDAFSNVVVRGDLIVGGVMFGIVTIVQYVVIARGAERVAEVAARFALDGLPGHQSAIDADLREGVISAQEAASRRAKLAERSSFYGAMDGAVRFVKGDAVAGLAITGVNLVGGMAIGMLQEGFTLRQSLDVYARLTIGDGLLAQIPALLVSLAAGVLVSRVDSEQDRPRPSLSWLEPAMLVVPASMLLLLALVPQMPSLAFLVTATMLLTLALILAARTPGRPSPAEEAARKLVVTMAASDVQDRRAVERGLAEVRSRCREALGIRVPPITLRAAVDVPAGRLEVHVGDRRLARVELSAARGEDEILLATFRGVMEHPQAFIDLQDLAQLVERARATHPVVVKRALEIVGLEDVLQIVRGFLRERIPLPPMPAILGVLAENRRFRDPAERSQFPEIVRVELADLWVHGMLDGIAQIGQARWVRMMPDAEEELLDRVVLAEDGISLSLTATERIDWIAAVCEVAGVDAPTEVSDSVASSMGLGPIVMIATPRARRAVAELVWHHRPHIPVLSTVELVIGEAEVEPRWLALP